MNSKNNPNNSGVSLLIGQIQVTFTLALIFIAAYILFKSGPEQTVLAFIRWYLGIFMLGFATIKLLEYKIFVLAFSTFDILAKRIKAYAYIYPLIILGLSVTYLIDILPYLRNIATLIIALVASIGIIQDVYIKRNQLSCGILGKIIRMPFTTIGLIECAALISMSALSLQQMQ